jgi:hypothetical protein
VSPAERETVSEVSLAVVCVAFTVQANAEALPFFSKVTVNASEASAVPITTYKSETTQSKGIDRAPPKLVPGVPKEPGIRKVSVEVKVGVPELPEQIIDVPPAPPKAEETHAEPLEVNTLPAVPGAVPIKVPEVGNVTEVAAVKVAVKAYAPEKVKAPAMLIALPLYLNPDTIFTAVVDNCKVEFVPYPS